MAIPPIKKAAVYAGSRINAYSAAMGIISGQGP